MFSQRLRKIQEQKESALCIGLDPDPDRLPLHLRGERAQVGAVRTFLLAIIDATHDLACAYKPNFAFFERLGPAGWTLLHEVAEMIPADTLSIADAKRGDIGNSSRFYADAVFGGMGFDACTVAPYMGRDSVMPFLDFPGKAAFVLARTSNAGAADFQEQTLGDAPLYAAVAAAVGQWSDQSAGEAGLVVGATSASALMELRALCPKLPFLVPGVGAQGGDAAGVMNAGATATGLVIVNSSREILYASAGEDFAEASRRAAHDLRDQLQRSR